MSTVVWYLWPISYTLLVMLFSYSQTNITGTYQNNKTSYIEFTNICWFIVPAPSNVVAEIQFSTNMFAIVAKTSLGQGF